MNCMSSRQSNLTSSISAPQSGGPPTPNRGGQRGFGRGGFDRGGRGRGNWSRGRGDSGDSTPKRQRRGFGYSGNAYASLSKLLDRDRPFLKPIHFVPSSLTPTLFREEEDILQPTHEQPSAYYPHTEITSRDLNPYPFQSEKTMLQLQTASCASLLDSLASCSRTIRLSPFLTRR